MLVEEAHESEVAQRAGGHRLVHVARASIPPGPVPVVGRSRGPGFVQSAPPKLLEPGARLFPLAPDDTSHLPAHPRIQFLEADPDLRHPEVGNPTPQKRAELPGDAAQIAASRLTEEGPELGLEPFHRLGGHSQSWLAVRGDAVAEELALPRTRHRALIPIDR